MSPYEALYGWKCHTPLNWSETGDSRIFRTDLMLEAEKQVKEIRDRLQLAKSRQKSYYDAKHRQISFEPGEHVYERSQEVSDPRKIGTQIYRSIPRHGQSQNSCLPVGIGARIVRSTQRVSHLTAKKMHLATGEND